MKKLLLTALSILAFQIAYADNYAVTVKGQKAGRAELNINVNDDSYNVKLGLYPVMLAKLLGIDDMIETAKGSIRQGQFYPTNYRSTDKKGKTLLNVNFAGTTAKVTSEEKGRKTLTIDKKGQDPLSQIAQIQHDLEKGAIQKDYYLVTDDNQRRYSAVATGKKVTLTEQPSKRRQLILWFDDQLTLVKMQKNKAGKVDFLMKRTGK